MKLFAGRTKDDHTLALEKMDQRFTYDSPGMRAWAHMITLQAIVIFVVLPLLFVFALAVTGKPLQAELALVVLLWAYVVGYATSKLEQYCHRKNYSDFRGWCAIMAFQISNTFIFIAIMVIVTSYMR